MAELILHYYPVSPFAEKVRLILGYKRLAARGVTAPMIAPKPDLTALTGGYRRIPVLQIGADIYCDTALICDVLEARAPTPTLYPEGSKGLTRILAQWADSTLFTTAMGYNFSPEGARHVFRDQPPEALQAFAEDRLKMRGGAPRMPPPDAAVAFRSYLRRIANLLDASPYLAGAVPSLADFSCYHPLWFTARIPPLAHILDATPQIGAWMRRIAALGDSEIRAMTADEAIAVARAATPAALPPDAVFQDEHGIALGSPVGIVAESFGLEVSYGTLIAATRTHYTLRREDPRAGTLHVHFPRVGFLLRPAG
jgi:glutathione S-transferase